MSEERDPEVQGVVTGVAVSINGAHSDEDAKRIEDAVCAEILKCNEEGISTEEKNSDTIRERMHIARQREMDAILAERAGQP